MGYAVRPRASQALQPWLRLVTLDVMSEVCVLTWYILNRPEFTLPQFGTPTAIE